MCDNIFQTYFRNLFSNYFPRRKLISSFKILNLCFDLDWSLKFWFVKILAHDFSYFFNLKIRRVAWDSCIGLSMQYSRELNMKAIRTAAETARFIGMDAITITTTNYNIINAFNSVDHVGSLLHGFKNGIGSVARKNWYTMVRLKFLSFLKIK